MLGRDTVWVIRDGQDTETGPEQVVRGDLVRVRPGLSWEAACTQERLRKHGYNCIMTQTDFSRFAVVSRRTALSGALGAALLAVAGCGNDDSALSGGASGATSPATTPSPRAGLPSAAASSASSTEAKSGSSLPASAKLSVSFTFAAASSGGPMRNPYVAVWIENSVGELVKTVALWHEDRGGQDRWLSEMKAFSALGAADAQTVSSATRQPGSYAVEWDGSTLEGGRATAGTYQLFVEAAREHGPYEIVQQEVSLGSKAATFALTPSGELTEASAAYAL